MNPNQIKADEERKLWSNLSLTVGMNERKQHENVPQKKKATHLHTPSQMASEKGKRTFRKLNHSVLQSVTHGNKKNSPPPKRTMQQED